VSLGYEPSNAAAWGMPQRSVQTFHIWQLLHRRPPPLPPCRCMKLTVKAGWQVLANVSNSHPAAQAAVRAWLLREALAPPLASDGTTGTPRSAAATTNGELQQALAQWCRADSTLLPVIGWLTFHAAHAAADPAPPLTDLARSGQLLSTLLRLAATLSPSGGDGIPGGGSGHVGGSDVDWLVGICGLLLRQGLVCEAYSRVGSAAGVPSVAASSGAASLTDERGSTDGGATFAVSFEQVVLLRAAVAATEDDASARQQARCAVAGGRVHVLSGADCELLWRELDRLCSWLLHRTPSAMASQAGESRPVPTATSAADEAVASVAKQWALATAGLICALLADELATDEALEAQATSAPAAAAASEPLGPRVVTSDGGSAGSDKATTSTDGVAGVGSAADGGAVAAPPSQYAAVLSGLCHVLCAHHKPVHRDAGRRGASTGGAGSGSASASTASDEENDAVPVAEGIRLLSLALSGVAAADAEAVVTACPTLVPLVLYHSQKLESERPTLREWAVLCIRALLQRSSRAADIAREIQSRMSTAAAAEEARACAEAEADTSEA